MSTSENNPPSDLDQPSDSAQTSQRDARVQSPYDRLINQTLQQTDAARTLVAKHLPSEVVQHLKLDTLTLVDTSFIDLNLRRRFADRLMSVELSDEVVASLSLKTKHAYVFVLLDHKSTDEPRTLVQILGYIVRIWENAGEPRGLLIWS